MSTFLWFQGLLDYLCEQFSLDKVDRTAVVRSTLTSIGRLRYLQPAVMDSIAGWMHERVDVLNVKDLVQFLITSANLNYTPTNSTQFFEVRCSGNAWLGKSSCSRYLSENHSSRDAKGFGWCSWPCVAWRRVVTVHSWSARTAAFEIRVDPKLLHKFVEFAPKYDTKIGTTS